MTTAAVEAVFRYPKVKQILTDWALLIVALCAFFGYIVVQRGQNVRNSLLFLSVVAGFFFVMWVVCRLQLNTITVDEQAIRTKALWGLIHHTYAWDSVDRIQYATVQDPLGRFTVPKTYYVLRRGERGLFGLQPRHVGATVELIGFPALLAVMEQKAAEHGFPIEPMS